MRGESRGTRGTRGDRDSSSGGGQYSMRSGTILDAEGGRAGGWGGGREDLKPFARIATVCNRGVPVATMLSASPARPPCTRRHIITPGPPGPVTESLRAIEFRNTINPDTCHYLQVPESPK